MPNVYQKRKAIGFLPSIMVSTILGYFAWKFSLEMTFCLQTFLQFQNYSTHSRNEYTRYHEELARTIRDWRRNPAKAVSQECF